MTCKTCKGFGYLLTVPSTCSAGGDRVACPVCTPSQRLDAKEGGLWAKAHDLALRSADMTPLTLADHIYTLATPSQRLDAKEGDRCSFCDQSATTTVADDSDVFDCCATCEAAWQLDPGFTKSATPSQRLDAATVERLLDPWRRVWMVAFEPFDNGPGEGVGRHPEDAGVADLLPKAWPTIADLRALSTEPHQHGGKGA